jgi:hypothetical protein
MSRNYQQDRNRRDREGRNRENRDGDNFPVRDDQDYMYSREGRSSRDEQSRI